MNIFMSKQKQKTAVEKFFDTLNEEEKEILSVYLQKQEYESLSGKFDGLLKISYANKKINN